jgi:hypothetical protein
MIHELSCLLAAAFNPAVNEVVLAAFHCPAKLVQTTRPWKEQKSDGTLLPLNANPTLSARSWR